MTRTALTRTGIALLLVAALAACSSKVSEENYARIADGMSEEQVGSMLGIASESRNTTVKLQETYTSTQSKWKGDQGTIVVVFLNGKVQAKRFYPPGTEPAPDSSR